MAHAEKEPRFWRETLERIYIGRRFKNDTERLEKLLALYTQMTQDRTSAKAATKKPRRADP